MQERPRFRNDLVAQPIEEEGVRYVDVTDPNSGSTFRFYDVEYSIACAMDGARDLEGLAQWTRAELGIETSPDELASVVNTLADLGYLEAAHAATAPGVVDDTAAEVSAAYDQVMELGPPGASPLAARPVAAPAPEIELGSAGAGLAARSSQPAAEPERESFDESVTRPMVELGAPGAPDSAPATPMDETSFEGLIDEEQTDVKEPPSSRPTPTRVDTPAPARRTEGLSPDGGAPAGFARRGGGEGLQPPSIDDEEPTRIPAPASLAGGDEDDDDVSVDLSAHLTVDKEEVVEAVRSSRVMSVPDVPTDFQEDEKPTAAGEALAALADAVRPAAPSPPPLPAEEEAKETSPEPMPLPAPPEVKAVPKPAIPLPATPPPSASKAIAATKQPAAAASQKKSSPGLLIFLVVLFAGAVAVYFLRDKIFGGDDESETKATGPRPVKPVKPTPPTPVKPPQAAPAPTAKLTAAGGSADVASAADGTIGWVIENGATVVEGDVVAKLAGTDQIEKKIERAKKDLANDTARLEFYTKQNNAAKIAEKQGLVDKDNAAIAAGEKELAALVLKAPGAGIAQLLAGKGAKVKAGDPVIRIGGDPVLVATFTVGAGASAYAPTKTCHVASKAVRDKEYACVVDATDAAAGTVTVSLVAGSAAAEGDEVVLLPPGK